VATGKSFACTIADAEEEMKASFELRYAVYCLERRWLRPLDYPDCRETDYLDPYAVHFVAKDAARSMLATVRLIVASDCPYPLPIAGHPGVTDFNSTGCGEISRLAVRREWRADGVALGLYRAMYHYSKSRGVQTWCIQSERHVVRMLRAYGFRFQPVGPARPYMGLVRVPAVMPIEVIEREVATNNPRLFAWFQEAPDPPVDAQLLCSLVERGGYVD
jgi:N-acyl-L-homoserine lactone synthetase